jgi:hypothetical protein
VSFHLLHLPHLIILNFNLLLREHLIQQQHHRISRLAHWRRQVILKAYLSGTILSFGVEAGNWWVNLPHFQHLEEIYTDLFNRFLHLQTEPQECNASSLLKHRE